jgi:hypothetical protein
MEEIGLPLDGYSHNLIFKKKKKNMLRKFKVLLTSEKNNRHFT